MSANKMKQLLKTGLTFLFLTLSVMVFSQNEKPKTQEAKKSESSCDNYAEFKKKQKAMKDKQAAEATKQEAKK